MADADAWLAEQREVWGDGDDFRRVTERLQYWDWLVARESTRLCENGGTAQELASLMLGVMAPTDAASPALDRAMERYRKSEADLLADVADSMRREVVPHSITWRIADAFLRGFRELGPAVTVFPDGYNANAQA